MKVLWVVLMLVMVSFDTEAQSQMADQQASCNASFHEGCKTEKTSTTSSNGFAAPIGMLGSSALEDALVFLLIGGGIFRYRSRRRATAEHSAYSSSQGCGM